MRRFGAVLATGVLLAVAGCGGGSSDRPSADEVSAALQKTGEGAILPTTTKIDEKQADCIAKLLVGSKLSDRALKALVKGDKTYSPSKADTSAAAAISSKLVSCVQ